MHCIGSYRALCIALAQSHWCLDVCWLCSVLRPRQHSIWETVFTGQKTQPTVSKYWRKIYKRQSKQRKTKYTYTQTI